MDSVSQGDTVYVIVSSIGSCEPFTAIHESVVEAVVPKVGIIMKIGESAFVSRREDVFSSKDDAILEAASRLKVALKSITDTYERKIKELESRVRA